MIYIYGLVCPIAKVVRYVGKTNRPKQRFEAHLSAAGRYRHRTANWLSGLKSRGLKPELVILRQMEATEDWSSVERWYIANGASLGWRLTNTTPGGEGGGYIREDDKERWRKSVATSLQRPEVRLKISNSVRAALARPATKAAQSRNMKEHWADPVSRQAMLSAMLAANRNPELRAHRSAISTERMGIPAERERVSVALKAYYSTEQGRANKVRTSNDPAKRAASVEGQLKNWADPSYRAANHAAKTTAVVLEKQATGARNQWVDPDVRAKMVAAMKAAWVRRKSRKAESTA